MRALSLWQPWAWSILYAGKRMENRPWRTRFRGRFLLHAAKGFGTRAEYAAAEAFIAKACGKSPPSLPGLPRGAIVGAASIVDCVSGPELGNKAFQPEWFFGPYAFVLDDVVALETPIPCTGAQGLFNVPPEVEAEIRRRFG